MSFELPDGTPQPDLFRDRMFRVAYAIAAVFLVFIIGWLIIR